MSDHNPIAAIQKLGLPINSYIMAAMAAGDMRNNSDGAAQGTRQEFAMTEPQPPLPDQADKRDEAQAGSRFGKIALAAAVVAATVTTEYM